MEITSNLQAAQSLNFIHAKRADLAADKPNEDYPSKNTTASNPPPQYRNGINPSSSLNQNEVFLKVDNRLIRFCLDEFLFLENVGDYVSIKTTKGSFMVHATMKTMEMKLSHPAFVKVHRSYIINISKIAYIEDNAIVIDKKSIPISRAHKAELLEKLNVL
jgi:DNA-binding LytR/AlgR family response regulator